MLWKLSYKSPIAPIAIDLVCLWFGPFHVSATSGREAAQSASQCSQLSPPQDNMKKPRCRNNAGTTWHFLLEKLQAQGCLRYCNVLKCIARICNKSTAPSMFLLCLKLHYFENIKQFKQQRISGKSCGKAWNTEARPAGKAGKEESWQSGDADPRYLFLGKCWNVL